MKIKKTSLLSGFFAAIAAMVILTGTAAAQGPTPQKQIEDFYTLTKQGKAGEALQGALSASETVKEDDAKRVADTFAKMVETMGEFVDYEVTKEVAITKRTMVMRIIAHFSSQPFMNEFTFYNSGDGWRIIHLRYDANPATMFQRDLADKALGG